MNSTLPICGYCGAWHQGTVCPRIESIEYYPDGSTKSIKLRDIAPPRPRCPRSPNPCFCDGSCMGLCGRGGSYHRGDQDNTQYRN